MFMLPSLLLAVNPTIKCGMKAEYILSLLTTQEMYISDMFAEIPIPNFVKTIDQTTFYFNDAKINGASYIISSVHFSKPGLVHIEFSSLSVNFWSYVSIDNTTSYLAGLEISSDDASLSISILNSSGSPKINAQDLKLNINSQFSSTLPTAQNSTIANYIQSNLKSFEYRITQWIYNEINKLNARFAEIKNIPVEIMLMDLDFSLAGDSAIENEYFVIPLTGSFPGVAMEEARDTLPKMSSGSPGYPVQLQISDTFVASVATWKLYTLYEQIVYLPQEMSIQLTTDGLRSLFPALEEVYGKHISVPLMLLPSQKWNNVTISTSTSVTATFGITTQFLIEPKLYQTELAIQIDTLFEVNFKYSLNAQTGSVEVHFIKPLENHIDYSSIGKINSRELIKKLGVVLKETPPLINTLLNSFSTGYQSIGYFYVESYLFESMKGFTKIQANPLPNN